MALVCQTRDSPPTTISWYRDGVLLDTNREPGLNMDVTVTNRSSSSFEIALQICQEAETISGNYTLEVDGLGNDTTSIRVYGTYIIRVLHQCGIKEPVERRQNFNYSGTKKCSGSLHFGGV